MRRTDIDQSTEPMTIDARLHTAIRKLRAQCYLRPSALPDESHTSPKTLDDPCKRLDAFQNLIVRARSREAD
jgi:hypothetical protein